MYDLRIVTHVYAKRLPFYAELLRFHLLGSFGGGHGTGCKVRVDVLHDPSDDAVVEVLRQSQAALRSRASVTVLGWPLEPAKLFRRAIGRNMAATNPQATVLWFADVDYVYGPGACKAAAALGADAPLCMPEFVLRSKSHSDGEAELRTAAAVPVVCPDRYQPTRERRAIGGMQIIGAKLAQQIGYCRGTKWLEPVDTSRGFACFRDDVAWRRVNKLGYGKPVPIPNVYRLRHAEAGHNIIWSSDENA